MMNDEYFSDKYDQYLSYHDLLNVPGFEEAWEVGDENFINSALYALGADLSYGYYSHLCDHRDRLGTLRKESVRFSFKERTDPNYVRNYMSVEDIIRTTSDKSLRDEMNQMSKRQGLGLHIKNNVKDEDE